MKFFFTLIFFISSLVVHAQETDLIENDQSAAIESLEVNPAETQEDESEDNITPDPESEVRFIPTEQISQDLGVSFPVDI